jgi:hypothetical protein
MKFKTLLLIILLNFNNVATAIDILPPFGNKKKNTKKEIKETKKLFPFTFVMDGDTAERACRIRIFEKGKPLGNFPEEGIFTIGTTNIMLPDKRLIAEISSGPRMTVWKKTIEAGPKAKPVRVMLEEFFPLEKNNWYAADLFVPENKLSPQKMSLQIKGTGLRTAGVSLVRKLDGQYINANDNHIDIIAEIVGYMHGRDLEVFGGKKTFPYSRTLQLYKLPQIYSKPTEEEEAFTPIFKEENISESEAISVWVSFDADPDYLYALFTESVFSAIDTTVNEFNFKLWLKSLSYGYKIPAVGGCDYNKKIPEIGAYINFDEEINASAIIDKINSGRLIVTNGPFINININSAGMGDTIPASYHQSKVQINAFASSGLKDAIKRIEIIYNNKIIKKYPGTKNQRSLHVGDSLIFNNPGYVVARYISTDEKVFAHTNAIYVRKNISSSPIVKLCKLNLKLDKNSSQREGIVEIWDKGKLILRSVFDKNGIGREVPPSSSIIIFDSNNKKLKEISIYEASGADKFAARIACYENMEKELLKKSNYNLLAEILSTANVIFNFKTNSFVVEE